MCQVAHQRQTAGMVPVPRWAEGNSPQALYYCFVTTVQYKKCCFTTTITEVCYEYVSPVKPTPALRDQRRCAGCVSLLRQPKPETLPGAQRRRVVDDHQMPELPVLSPSRALVETRFHSASH